MNGIEKLIRRGIKAESQAASEIWPKLEIFYEKHYTTKIRISKRLLIV